LSETIDYLTRLINNEDCGLINLPYNGGDYREGSRQSDSGESMVRLVTQAELDNMHEATATAEASTSSASSSTPSPRGAA